MYTCKYCGKKFSNKQQLGGHVTFCKLNPNNQHNLDLLHLARNNKNKKNENFVCKYCGKKVGNNGCLVLHERRCKLNSLYVPTQKQIEREIKKNKPRKLSEETKQKIREGLARWKKQNEQLFLEYSRGKSKCCENFKQMLRNKNISFIEEYTPFIPEKLYSLDIAFPNEKIGIEINGSQHYTTTGELNEKTIEKQKYFEEQGWKIFQVYYKQCYNININNFSDILTLDIYDKSYIQKDFDLRYKNKVKKELERKKYLEQREKEKLQKEEIQYSIIKNLIENSGIDFSKSGWSRKAQEYIKKYNPEWNSGVFRIIRKYCPEFLKQNNVWKRKGSIF
jgi:very-short-patch-repair endonuclease